MSAIMSLAGRPTSDPKHERVTIRVSAKDLAALRRAAKKQGCSVGDVARQLIRAGLGIKNKKETTR